MRRGAVGSTLRCALMDWEPTFWLAARGFFVRVGLDFARSPIKLAPVRPRCPLSIVITRRWQLVCFLHDSDSNPGIKRRSRAGVWAKMAQAAGGSKRGRGGAERLSEAPHACRAPAGCCTSAGWRAAAENERNHTTSENAAETGRKPNARDSHAAETARLRATPNETRVPHRSLEP